MSYRDDLAAAHARIAALEAELARVREECERLRAAKEALLAGTPIEDEDVDAARELRLREQMRREDAEVRAKVRRDLEATQREATRDPLE